MFRGVFGVYMVIYTCILRVYIGVNMVMQVYTAGVYRVLEYLI